MIERREENLKKKQIEFNKNKFAVERWCYSGTISTNFFFFLFTPIWSASVYFDARPHIFRAKIGKIRQSQNEWKKNFNCNYADGKLFKNYDRFKESGIECTKFDSFFIGFVTTNSNLRCFACANGACVHWSFKKKIKT